MKPLFMPIPFNVDSIPTFLVGFSVEGLGNVAEEVNDELERVGHVVGVAVRRDELLSIVSANGAQM